MWPAMLFVPGSDPRKLGKIPALSAEALLLDLEDGVAQSAKAQAREQVASALAEFGASKPLWVRVNAADSPELYDDLHAVVVPGSAGINLPKVESAEQLARVDWLIGELERRRGLEVGSLTLMATIETARGLHYLGQIAAASPRLRCLCFGAADYSRDLGLAWPPAGGQLSPSVIQAKIALVQASAAFGLDAPHDGASAEFRDLERLDTEARAARALGYGGKHAIHPAQVPIIGAAFEPSPAELQNAEQIVSAFEQQAAAGVGAFALGGVMVDAPVAARARALLERTAGRRERA